MKINRIKRANRKVSKAMIIRSVASSTAIETGQSIRDIETRLKAPSRKFRHLAITS